MALMITKLRNIVIIGYRHSSVNYTCKSAHDDTEENLTERAPPDWKKHRQDARYGNDTWRPIKRLSRDQMEHLKTLHSEQPETWTVKNLAAGFRISTSAVTRILRSKFEPSPEAKERQDASALKSRMERRLKFTGGK